MPPVPKSIADRDRLIFAMDVADPDAARRLTDQLGDSVQFYKLGLELFMSGRYFELLDWMDVEGQRVPVIFMTGQTELQTELYERYPELRETLRKPFDPDRLISRVPIGS